MTNILVGCIVVLNTDKQEDDVVMPIQKAAHQILVEEGHPLPSRIIAKQALEREMAASKSKDPIQSLAQTIEKNIRDGVYNNPELIFMTEDGRRVIGLPGWKSGRSTQERPSPSLQIVKITEKDFEKVKLAIEAGVGPNETEVLSRLIHSGFKVLRDEMLSGLSTKHAAQQKKIDELTN